MTFLGVGTANAAVPYMIGGIHDFVEFEGSKSDRGVITPVNNAECCKKVLRRGCADDAIRARETMCWGSGACVAGDDIGSSKSNQDWNCK